MALPTPAQAVRDRLVSGAAPAVAPAVLAGLLAITAVTAHLTGTRALTAAAAVTLTVLAGLWVGDAAAYGWVLAATLVCLPLPLRPLSAGLTAVAAGLMLVAVVVVRSLSALVSTAQARALQHYGERVELDRQARARHEELTGKVEYWASHDRLTEVLNRTTLTRHLGDLAAAGTPTGILVVSLARFSAVNDGLGPEVGDEVLAALARRLRSRARDSDLVARLSGDEFAVVLPGLSAEAARPVADRLLQVLGDPVTVGPHLVSVHARCGLALDEGDFRHGGAELLHRATAAARTAPVDGEPAVFSAASHAEAQAQTALEADLAQALARDELFLLYQPLVSTRTGCIESVEALVRWRHPERGLVAPDAFIGTAERSGQIVPIGLRVLELALAQLRQWSALGRAPMVAVNVSARQLVEPDFVAQVQRVLWAAQVDPHDVLLELTESLFVEDSDSAATVLWQLRGLGLRLAIDDFGTGYSSLARLGELPINEMKIDKSLVDRLGVEPHDTTALVTAAVAMGHGLGLSVVAEGVETADQAAQLAHLGCDLLQGYLLGRPQPAAEVTAQLGHRLLVDPGQIPAPRPSVTAGAGAVPGVLPPLS